MTELLIPAWMLEVIADGHILAHIVAEVIDHGEFGSLTRIGYAGRAEATRTEYTYTNGLELIVTDWADGSVPEVSMAAPDAVTRDWVIASLSNRVFAGGVMHPAKAAEYARQPFVH